MYEKYLSKILKNNNQMLKYTISLIQFERRLKSSEVV